MSPYKLDYPIAFDYESDSVEYAKKNGVEPDKAHVTSLAYAFCGRIEQAKYYAMIYTNPSYLSKYFDSYIPKNYDIWLAQWPSQAGSRQQALSGGRHLAVHQLRQRRRHIRARGHGRGLL